MHLDLDVPRDFRFYQTLQDSTRQPFGLTECLNGETYCTLIEDQLVAITHLSDQSKLLVEYGNRLDQPQLTIELRRRFGLDQDLENYYARLSGDPVYGKIILPLKGLRIFQKATPFEALVTAIADQQLNLPFAETLKSRLIENFGVEHKFNNFILYKFPTPEHLARQDELALRRFQFTTNKSRFIIRLAKSIIDGEIYPKDWYSLDDEKLLTNLQSIYGVGPWTAEYVALVGYQRLNMLPAADIGLLNATQKVYQLSKRPTQDEMRQIASNWEPYRGMVTFYLWYAYEQGLLGNQ